MTKIKLQPYKLKKSPRYNQKGATNPKHGATNENVANLLLWKNRNVKGDTSFGYYVTTRPAKGLNKSYVYFAGLKVLMLPFNQINFPKK